MIASAANQEEALRQQELQALSPGGFAMNEVESVQAPRPPTDLAQEPVLAQDTSLVTKPLTVQGI